jgi:dCMP deaminase
MTNAELKKHNIFLDIAENISLFSTCASRQVGAIYVKDDRILSTGYNGVPSGHTHCNEIFNVNLPDYKRSEHTEWSSINEIHAEMNGIVYAAKNGINLENSILYCTISPCHECAKNLINLNIKKIYFRKYYDGLNINNNTLKNYLKHSGIELINIPKDYIL